MFNILVSFGQSKAGILGGWEGKSNTSEKGWWEACQYSEGLDLVCSPEESFFSINFVMQNSEYKVKSC